MTSNGSDSKLDSLHSESVDPDNATYGLALLTALHDTDWEFVKSMYFRALGEALENTEWKVAEALIRALGKTPVGEIDEDRRDELVDGVYKVIVYENFVILRLMLELGMVDVSSAMDFTLKRKVPPLQCLKMLFKFGANPNKGFLAIIKEYNGIQLIKTFLDAGADPNRGDGKALIKAVNLGNVDVVKLLVRRNSDIKVVEKRKKTPHVSYSRYRRGRKKKGLAPSLMASAFQKAYDRHDWDMVKTLISLGADPTSLTPAVPKDVLKTLIVNGDDDEDTEEIPDKRKHK